MRAARIHEFDGRPVVEDVDEPTPGQDEALLELEAAALNPLDVVVATGKHYAGHPPLPYVPGCEGVGRLDGARVYVFGGGIGTRRDGTLAARALVPRDVALPVPDGVEPALAAACGIAGVAGWVPVTRVAEVGPEDCVLVLGATGTVGSVAVQAAKLRGAARIVAAGRDPGRLERARELGADEVVRLGGDDDAAALREACGGDGPTVVIDPVWGAPLEAAAAAAAPGARIVNIGASAGDAASLPSSLVRGKRLRLEGHTNFALSEETRREAYQELLEAAKAGRLRIDVETHPLDEAAEAWRRVADGGGTKVVVTP